MNIMVTPKELVPLYTVLSVVMKRLEAKNQDKLLPYTLLSQVMDKIEASETPKLDKKTINMLRLALTSTNVPMDLLGEVDIEDIDREDTGESVQSKGLFTQVYEGRLRK